MEFTNRGPYPPTRVAAVLFTSGSRYQTIQTVCPHNVKADAQPGNIPKPFWVEISGATNSNYNGRFRVTGPADNDGSSMSYQAGQGVWKGWRFFRLWDGNFAQNFLNQ